MKRFLKKFWNFIRFWKSNKKKVDPVKEWSDLPVVCGDGSVRDWKETLEITNVRRDGNLVIWDYVGATPITLNWGNHRLGRANVGFIIVEDGKEVAEVGATDWLRDSNINWQVDHNFQSMRSPSDYKFVKSHRYWKPKSGQTLMIFVCGRNWGTTNVQERSNKIPLIW